MVATESAVRIFQQNKRKILICLSGAVVAHLHGKAFTGFEFGLGKKYSLDLLIVELV